MKRSKLILLATALAINGFSCSHSPQHAKSGPAATASAIQWQPWSDEAFARAKKEGKLVILDLQAVWCHWCHVMEETTYRDPEVVKLLGERYIALQVDQDARPDISNRYTDWGWPATIVFNADGVELAKRAGYIKPEKMRELLREKAANPVAEADSRQGPDKFPETHFLAETQRKALEKAMLASFDFKKGGWKTFNRLIDAHLIEYGLMKSREGDSKAEKMVRLTLMSQRKLLDPAWGGMYQYSVRHDWNEPHFEKIMSLQTDNINAYSWAYLATREPIYLATAKETYRFLRDFLSSPEGLYYTSQDADLKQGEHSAEFFALSDPERRKLGIPRIDKNIYARENGWVIEALTNLYAATGEQEYLDRARDAATRIEKARALEGGGFRHAENDVAGPYLGDTLAMSRAFLGLYAVTGEREWLDKARRGADFIEARFAPSSRGDSLPGYASDASSGSAKLATFKPVFIVEENLQLARFANLLFHYTGAEAYQSMSRQAMRYLAAPEIHDKLWNRAGVLTADRELGRDPMHLTVVGRKDDPEALSLFKAALAYPVAYRRIEWWDKREGEMPRKDVAYPELKRAAIFACGEGRCSRPAYSADDLRDRVRSLAGK